ncbi:hypothetical protein BKA70DRAFT_1323673 [Coprinopsis sp. MPI-PUGE-AT-0042]|nr:hypothetical protein BKA70DRAFT_1323673 [Coprinopsis sp. MPI-PUGE-AT-0042]
MLSSASRHSRFLLALALISASFTSAQTPYGTTVAVLDDWMANTDATLTFRGSGRGSSVNPFEARVIWCTSRNGGVCGGECTVYTGRGDQCFAAPNTSCVAATTDITFCASTACTSPCNVYRSCGTRMDSGFCFTPWTGSVQLPAVEGTSSSSSSSSTSSSSSSTREPEPTPQPQPQPTPSTDDDPPPSTPPVTSSDPPASRTSTPVSQSSTSSSSSSLPSARRSSAQSDASLPTGGVTDDANKDDNSSSSESSEQKKSSFPIGAIIGIVLGTLVIICATILIIFWLRWKQRREQNASDDFAGTTVPFMQTSPFGSHPSTPALLSYTSGPSNGYVSPALVPPADASHTRSTSDLTSTVSSSTFSRPLRKGEALSGPVSRPTDEIPQGQFVVVHADSGVRVPGPQNGAQPLELPPMYTPS